MTYPLRFFLLNSPCMRISTHIDDLSILSISPSGDDYRLFTVNLVTFAFVSFRPPYLCPSEGHKHDVSIHTYKFE